MLLSLRFAPALPPPHLPPLYVDVAGVSHRLEGNVAGADEGCYPLANLLGGVTGTVTKETSVGDLGGQGAVSINESV